MSLSVVKKCHCHQKCCGGIGCAVVQQASSYVCTSSVKVTRSSVWLCYIITLLPESWDEVGVVTEVHNIFDHN